MTSDPHCSECGATLATAEALWREVGDGPLKCERCHTPKGAQEWR